MKTFLLIFTILVKAVISSEEEVDFRLYFCFMVFAQNKPQITQKLVSYIKPEEEKDKISLMSKKYTMLIFGECVKNMGDIDDIELYGLIRQAAKSENPLKIDGYMDLNINFAEVLHQPLTRNELLIEKQMSMLNDMPAVL